MRVYSKQVKDLKQRIQLIENIKIEAYQDRTVQELENLFQFVQNSSVDADLIKNILYRIQEGKLLSQKGELLSDTGLESEYQQAQKIIQLMNSLNILDANLQNKLQNIISQFEWVLQTDCFEKLDLTQELHFDKMKNFIKNLQFDFKNNKAIQRQKQIKMLLWNYQAQQINLKNPKFLEPSIIHSLNDEIKELSVDDNKAKIIKNLSEKFRIYEQKFDETWNNDWWVLSQLNANNLFALKQNINQQKQELEQNELMSQNFLLKLKTIQLWIDWLQKYYELIKICDSNQIEISFESFDQLYSLSQNIQLPSQLQEFKQIQTYKLKASKLAHYYDNYINPKKKLQNQLLEQPIVKLKLNMQKINNLKPPIEEVKDLFGDLNNLKIFDQICSELIKDYQISLDFYKKIEKFNVNHDNYLQQYNELKQLENELIYKIPFIDKKLELQLYKMDFESEIQCLIIGQIKGDLDKWKRVIKHINEMNLDINLDNFNQIIKNYEDNIRTIDKIKAYDNKAEYDQINHNDAQELLTNLKNGNIECYPEIKFLENIIQKSAQNLKLFHQIEQPIQNGIKVQLNVILKTYEMFKKSPIYYPTQQAFLVDLMNKQKDFMQMIKNKDSTKIIEIYKSFPIYNDEVQKLLRDHENTNQQLDQIEFELNQSDQESLSYVKLQDLCNIFDGLKNVKQSSRYNKIALELFQQKIQIIKQKSLKFSYKQLKFFLNQGYLLLLQVNEEQIQIMRNTIEILEDILIQIEISLNQINDEKNLQKVNEFGTIILDFVDISDELFEYKTNLAYNNKTQIHIESNVKYPYTMYKGDFNDKEKLKKYLGINSSDTSRDNKQQSDFQKKDQLIQKRKGQPFGDDIVDKKVKLQNDPNVDQELRQNTMNEIEFIMNKNAKFMNQDIKLYVKQFENQIFGENHQNRSNYCQMASQFNRFFTQTLELPYFSGLLVQKQFNVALILKMIGLDKLKLFKFEQRAMEDSQKIKMKSFEKSNEFTNIKNIIQSMEQTQKTEKLIEPSIKQLNNYEEPSIKQLKNYEEFHLQNNMSFEQDFVDAKNFNHSVQLEKSKSEKQDEPYDFQNDMIDEYGSSQTSESQDNQNKTAYDPMLDIYDPLDISLSYLQNTHEYQPSLKIESVIKTALDPEDSYNIPFDPENQHEEDLKQHDPIYHFEQKPLPGSIIRVYKGKIQINQSIKCQLLSCDPIEKIKMLPNFDGNLSIKGTSHIDKIIDWFKKEIKKNNFISGWVKGESQNEDKQIQHYANNLTEYNKVSGYKNDSLGIHINFLPQKILQQYDIYKLLKFKFRPLAKEQPFLFFILFNKHPTTYLNQLNPKVIDYFEESSCFVDLFTSSLQQNEYLNPFSPIQEDIEIENEAPQLQIQQQYDPIDNMKEKIQEKEQPIQFIQTQQQQEEYEVLSEITHEDNLSEISQEKVEINHKEVQRKQVVDPRKKN